MATILLVDDEESVISITSELLEMLGYQVIKALNGKEAMACVDTDRIIDLILLDVTLPDKNGIDLAHEILNRNPQQKIILCSGAMLDNGENEKIPAGILDSLPKPFTLTSLKAKLHQHITNQ